jgi:hypothetical protein
VSPFRFLDAAPDLPFLIVVGVVAGISAHQNTRPFRMDEIPMVAPATPVHETGLFQVGYELPDFAWHPVITIVSPSFLTVK